jgi:MoaA/NifB/PqqE/SkfB family radical SAM enzyme
MIVTKKNQHQIAGFESLARRLGVDGAYLMSLFIDRTADEEFVKRMETELFVQPGKEGLSRYFLDEAGRMRMYGADTLCPQDAKYPVITCDGDLIGCCYDIFLQHNFGNCLERSFVSLWGERRYADFRKGRMMPRRLDLCKNCMPRSREWRHRLF